MEYIIVPFVIVTLVLYIWYAKIICRRNSAWETLPGIDVQLKKCLELVLNILAIAKRFMTHIRSLIEDVTKLRSQASDSYDQMDPKAVAQHFETSASLGTQMSKFMISMKAYPDLKSDATMLQAQQTYNEVEAQISVARRFYNSSVAELNNSIEIFPGNLLSELANSKIMPFFEAEESALQPVKAAALLS